MSYRKGWFSRCEVALPFGHHETSSEQDPPANEVLIGREGQRAFLIDLLMNMGRRGAYLVTGRRGAGKTSFVRHCIEEYRSEVFGRYLRSTLGRALFWDRIAIYLFLAAALLGLLLLSQLAEVFVRAAAASEALPRTLLLCLLIVPIFFVCIYPLLYAKEILEAVFAGLRSTPNPDDRKTRLAAVIMTFALATAVWFVGPFGAPALGMSRLFAAFGLLTLWVNLTSFRPQTSQEQSRSEPDEGPPTPGGSGTAVADCRGDGMPPTAADGLTTSTDSGSGRGSGVVVALKDGAAGVDGGGVPPEAVVAPAAAPEDPKRRGVVVRSIQVWKHLLAFLRNVVERFVQVWKHLIAFLRRNVLARLLTRNWKHLIAFLLCMMVLGYGSAAWTKAPEQEFVLNLCLGLIFTGLAGLARGTFQCLIRPQQRVVESGVYISAEWYLLFGSLCLALAVLALLVHLQAKALAGGVIFVGVAALVVTFYVERHSKRQIAFCFQPRPNHVLVAKAVLCCVIALQLVHPLLARVDRHFLGSYLKPPETRLSKFLRHPISLHAVSRGSGDEELFHGRPRPGDPDVRGGVAQELYWMLATFLFLLLLLHLEHDWVIRPFLRQRQDRSFGARAAPWEDQEGYREKVDRRALQHELARLTLPWTICTVWLPVQVLSINLGFDRLDHRRVVHAMLAALRDEYHRTFLAWASPLATLARAAFVFAAFLLVALVGDHLFALPRVDEALASLDVQVEAGEMTVEEKDKLAKRVKSGRVDICALPRSSASSFGAARLLCNLPAGAQTVQILYHDLLGHPSSGGISYARNHLLLRIFPFSETVVANAPAPSVPAQSAPGGPFAPAGALLHQGLHFRVYHLGLFLFFLIAGRYLVRRLPFLPYHQAVQRMESVLDSLSGRTTLSSKQLRWKPAQWLQGYFTDESVKQTEKEVVDPRTVEFTFLTILHDIQNAPLRTPGAQRQLISLPTPEITFVFDELDKLGARLSPGEIGASGSVQEAEIQDAERRRSLELHRLLANMKNLLSSAPARFIFIAGRNLHDEWLADQTARQPLLTNIFNAEVYLPSLLTDHGAAPSPRFHDNIREYLLRQSWQAQLLYYRWVKSRWLPSFGLPIREMKPESFAEPTSTLSGRRAGEGVGTAKGHRAGRLDLPKPPRLEELRVFYCSDQARSPIANGHQFEGSQELITDFIDFATYRSMGNPKRLRELLATFVRPVTRAVREPFLWRQEFDCRHVLRFGDVERFRVQLLADVYRHLAAAFERRLVIRDDKMAVSVFFLADFLFKFHRRAFSWSNLERVDELLHIHRAPDLREVLEEIISRWSERFLHPIRNGMYAFRFRSDIAREIEYLSRQSSHEMAAFNFTLDESLALKSSYETTIRRLEGTVNPELQDLLAGLGELHEFDQEYETARQYYRKAIHVLDAELEQVLGQWSGTNAGSTGTEAVATKEGNRRSTISAVLAGREEGLGDARLFLTWGIARLRLMLQVALTFEHARNLERAAVEYRNARTLARILILAMLGRTGPWDSTEDVVAIDEKGSFVLLPEEPSRHEGRVHPLKILNIVFQPMFAEAWVAEKLSGGVDTSVSLAEKELWRLRELLPFVRDFGRLEFSTDPTKVVGTNFALIMAELHNKTGDLYFFKGRQLILEDDLERFERLATPPAGGVAPMEHRYGCEGYLLRAHYHYAMGLHELRRFVTHRRLSSKHKFNIWARGAFEDKELWETINANGSPDFVFRSVGGTLNDLAETMLGRVSLYGLFSDLQRKAWGPRAAEPEDSNELPPKRAKRQLTAAFGNWLTGTPEDGSHPIVFALSDYSLAAGTLEGWLGEWRNAADPQTRQLLRFPEKSGHDDRGRLLVSLHFTLVGAKYLERGGYFEDAASELLEVCEMVTNYFWWGLTIERLSGWWKEDQKELTLSFPGRTKSPLQIASGVFEKQVLQQPYFSYLYEVAQYALRKADQLFSFSRRNEGTDSDHLLGTIVPPAMFIAACSLAFVGRQIDDKLDDKFEDEELAKLISRWWGGDLASRKTLDAIHGDDGNGLRRLLEEALVRHSYPMISRLQGLKVLIDNEILSTPRLALEQADSPQREAVIKWVRELLTLNELFNAPLHFTPLQSGVTCALVDLALRRCNGSSWTSPGDAEDIRRAAQRYLATSEEMCTMRRAYYEAISDLYYLFDDLNDRQIHFNLAMQMAGIELVSLLRGLLRLPDAAAFRIDVSPQDDVERSASVPLRVPPLAPGEPSNVPL